MYVIIRHECVVGSCMEPVTIMPYTFLVYRFLTIECTATFCLHLFPLVHPLPWRLERWFDGQNSQCVWASLHYPPHKKTKSSSSLGSLWRESR